MFVECLNLIANLSDLIWLPIWVISFFPSRYHRFFFLIFSSTLSKIYYSLSLSLSLSISNHEKIY